MKTKTEVLLTQDLRDTLKILIKQEVARLPELLEELEPKERLAILCKLLPYVFPPIEAVPQVKRNRSKSYNHSQTIYSLTI